MPQVSVIVPVYNAEKTLSRCLDSLAMQTFKDIEIILINDGSTDKSKSICEKYISKFSNFHLLNQKNAGPASARNSGINKAAGKYISFVDADDFAEKNMIESMFTVAEESRADMVICGFYEEKQGKRVEHKFKYKTGLYTNEETYKIAIEVISDVSETRIPPYSWVRMIRKDILDNPPLRYADGMIRSEDYYYFVRVHFRINRLYLLLDQPLYHYMEVKDSVTHKYVKSYWKSVKQIYFGLQNELPKNENVSWRLDLMLMQRSLIALNNSARLNNKCAFRKEVLEIINDLELRNAAKRTNIQDNSILFKIYCTLMKMHLSWMIYLKYLIKFYKNKKVL